MTAHPARRARRAPAGAALATALLALALVLGACASPIRGSGRLATPTGPPAPTPIEAARTCPDIVDPVARLSYTCIDDSLERTFGLTNDPLFDSDSTMLTKTTEPGWVAVQQSGALRVDGPSARAVARIAGQQQAADNYGDDPRASTRLEQAVDGLGVEAYRWDQLITLDPGYVQQRRLLARSELLSTVVIKLADGGYVALTLSIPDTQKEWWPRLDAVIASLAVL